MLVEAQTTVKGGFPVIATARLCPAEPDVGIRDSYLEDVTIQTTAGKSCGWLQLSDGDLDAVEQALWEVYHAY